MLSYKAVFNFQEMNLVLAQSIYYRNSLSSVGILRMSKTFRVLVLLVAGLLTTCYVSSAQDVTASISMSVNAGFDGSFRENEWMPLYIRVSNDGGQVDGRLVVRPETSNSALTSTYSVPISLPQGARKTVFLYATALSFASQLRVELIANDGTVVAAQPTNVRSVQGRDQIHVVVSGSPGGSIDLTGLHDTNYNGFQANWTVSNIPDWAVALTSVNFMLFSDVDTGALSTRQRQAIADWVAQGGHLIVTGGPNWQATAAGLTDLLPLTPTGNMTIDDLSALREWTRFHDGDLKQSSVIATGALKPEAQTLVSGPNGVPLLARLLRGSGTIDYLAADPNTQPLRGWTGMGNLWLVLGTTVNPTPSWGYGISNWDQAVNAVNIMPGVNLLPDILPLCGFLAAYIALIGPLNYLVLNRINRREYAWVTIPVFILLFSALAWSVGFNLRGNEVTVSRLAVVQSWPNAERAQVQEVMGLLSPRRATYTLTADANSFLRPVPRIAQSSLLANTTQVSTDIQQTDVFRAADFPVDASFIAGFSSSAFIDKPAVNGQATLFYNDPTQGAQGIRGSVRNDSPYTLKDPIILVRGQSLALNKPIAPGEVATFDLTLTDAELPSPSPLAYAPGGFTSVFQRSYIYQSSVPQTIKDILGDQLPTRRLYSPDDDTPAGQEARRRRFFLSSFVSDAYNELTGRGNRAYLAAWSEGVSPLQMSLEGANWRLLDTTLFLVELNVQITPPSTEALVTSDQFTWAVRERASLNDMGPLDMSFQAGDAVAFQFTPLPNAVLRRVSELSVIVDRSSTSGRGLPLELWNWSAGKWENIQLTTDSNSYVVTDPARFLGPQNAVQVRVDADNIGGYPRIQDLSIEQRGEF
jgi:hypothetical protein